MTKILLVVLLMLFASVIADPAVMYSTGPFYTSSFGSAALLAPAVGPVAPLTSVPSVASLPYTSLYGAAYSYADYSYSPLLSSAYSLPYTLPALDWYYRK